MNDTASPAIVKAAAVKYLSDHNSNESVNTILNALKNTDARVRYEALISLNNYPVSVWINAAGSLLSDKVKAVRIAAAQLYTSLDANQIPADFTASFNSAKQELETYLFYQADFATGDVMLGDYFLKTKNYFNAEKFYKRALQKDTSMNYVRLNLSSAYNATSKNAEALNILLEARKIDPNNERIYYNLALLYVELNKQKEAAECFEKAIALHSTNTRLYYNYGLLLDQIGNMQKEISIYLKGLAIAPQDADLNYVLAIAYLKTGQKNKAIPCATILKAVNPSNPDYQRIFQELGL